MYRKRSIDETSGVQERKAKRHLSESDWVFTATDLLWSKTDPQFVRSKAFVYFFLLEQPEAVDRFWSTQKQLVKSKSRPDLIEEIEAAEKTFLAFKNESDLYSDTSTVKIGYEQLYQYRRSLRPVKNQQIEESNLMEVVEENNHTHNAM